MGNLIKNFGQSKANLQAEIKHFEQHRRRVQYLLSRSEALRELCVGLPYRIQWDTRVLLLRVMDLSVAPRGLVMMRAWLGNSDLAPETS